MTAAIPAGFPVWRPHSGKKIWVSMYRYSDFWKNVRGVIPFGSDDYQRFSSFGCEPCRFMPGSTDLILRKLQANRIVIGYKKSEEKNDLLNHPSSSQLERFR
jgi:hypothetical protein